MIRRFPGLLRSRLPEGGGDRGAATLELVIVFPAVLLLVFGVLQGALYFHARNVAMAAAQEGLRAARVQNGTAAAGGQRAAQFLTDVGGGTLMTGVTVSPARTATTASVTVRGQTLSLLALLPGVSVSQTAAGPVERFTSAAGTP